MRAFKSGWFQRFARKESIEDAALWDAVDRAEKGQIDADLGGEVIKQRIGRPGGGKSKGYRVIAFSGAVREPSSYMGFQKAGKLTSAPPK